MATAERPGMSATGLPTRHRMLALDLGAESGRGIVGTFDGDHLVLEEVTRFGNEPVDLAGTLVWDFPRLFREALGAIRRASAGGPLATIGVDAWGVDFGLLDANDRLLAMPVHYRDARTIGLVETAQSIVPASEIYATTGTQFLRINTLYQLMSLVAAGDPVLAQARTMLMIPDLVLRFLSGSAVCEFTNATTTQCFDPERGEWAAPLLARLGVPDRLLPPVIPPATVVGRLLPGVADDVGSPRARVIAPATHDTASAVAAIPLAEPPTTAWISSGTWSLVGVETERPYRGAAAFTANLSNEGGLGGKTLLLKNVTGLWLMQECRRALSRAGMDLDHATLIGLASRAPSRTAFVDPDDDRFFRPGDLPEAVRAFCRASGQPEPRDAGTVVRILLESLALKYAWTIRLLEGVVRRRIETIHVCGGGARNELLCQLTANAAGVPVRAGPVEAAAIGNLLGQALATGHIGSIAEGRDLVSRSFPLRAFEPHESWVDERARFATLFGDPGEGVPTVMAGRRVVDAAPEGDTQGISAESSPGH
jgi:rhamnulokinase